MNSADIDDPALVQHVRAWLRRGEPFEVVVSGNAWRRKAVVNALKSLEANKSTGTADSNKAAKVLGCIELALETKRYRWDKRVSPDVVTVTFLPVGRARTLLPNP